MGHRGAGQRVRRARDADRRFVTGAGCFPGCRSGSLSSTSIPLTVDLRRRRHCQPDAIGFHRGYVAKPFSNAARAECSQCIPPEDGWRGRPTAQLPQTPQAVSSSPQRSERREKSRGNVPVGSRFSTTTRGPRIRNAGGAPSRPRTMHAESGEARQTIHARCSGPPACSGSARRQTPRWRHPDTQPRNGHPTGTRQSR